MGADKVREPQPDQRRGPEEKKPPTRVEVAECPYSVTEMAQLYAKRHKLSK